MGTVNIIGNTISSNNIEVPDSGVEGLLDFDGVDDYVSLGSVPDVTGNKTISFKIYVSSVSTFSPILMFRSTTISDSFAVWVNSGDLYCYAKYGTSGTNASGTYDLTGLEDTILNVVVVKTAEQIVSITVNSVENAVLASTAYAGQDANHMWIGRYINGAGTSTYTTALIWDVVINGILSVAGHPSGNQNSAWEDTIGTNDGTVNGSPTTTDI